MDESDTAAILPGEVLSISSSEEDVDVDDSPDGKDDVHAAADRSVGPPCACPLPVFVELVMCLSTFSVVLQAPLSTQYLWDRVSEDLGYNGSKRSECGNSSVPDPLQQVAAAGCGTEKKKHTSPLKRRV